MLYFYTAVYGDHIPLPEFDTKGFEFRCYTDRKIESNTWKITTMVGDGTPLHPRLAAKRHKMFPPSLDGDISIWIDASITVTDVHEMVKVCKAALGKRDLALFKHPERDNIYDEAAISIALPKYAGLPLIEQVESYAAEGLPRASGLWAGGVIVRRHTERRVNFENDWWTENEKWSYQDQLSLPYVLWKHDVTPGVIPGSVYKTAFHTWTPTADPVKPEPDPLPIPTTHPLLSVITPTHNTKWLADCWTSLKRQTYTNFEWLVSVNDQEREASAGAAARR